jgi:WD40 repeat protein
MGQPRLEGVLRHVRTRLAARGKAGAAALAEEGLRGMLATKRFKAATPLLLAAGLAAAMAGAPADGPAAKGTERPAERKGARLDRHGDPLPDGAVARIGTTRFRHGWLINSLAFTADGKALMSQGLDAVRVWVTATGREARHLAAPPGRQFISAALSPDGKLLATTLWEQPLTLWDPATGKKVRDLPRGKYEQALFSPDGKALAVTTHEPRACSVELWDPAGGKELASWEAHAGRISSLGFTADGKVLMTAGQDRAVRLWDARTGRKLRELTGLTTTEHSVALSGDGRLLASVDWKAGTRGGAEPQNRVTLRDARTGKVLRHLTAPAPEGPPGWPSSLSYVAFSPDGKTLAASGAGRIDRVYVWDVRTGKERTSFPATQNALPCFSPDGKTLAVATLGYAIHLYDPATGKERSARGGLRAPPDSLAFLPEGRTLATTDGPDVVLWDARTGKERRRLEGHRGAVRRLLLSADGRTLVSCGSDGTVRVWDARTGRPRSRLTGGLGLLACSPDGKLLVLFGKDNVLLLLDAATGRKFQTLNPGHPWVRGVGFIANGRRLVAWCGDRNPRVWDVATGKELRPSGSPGGPDRRAEVPLPATVGAFDAGAVSPDGRLIAFGNSTGPSGLIAVHELAGGAELRSVEKLADGVGVLAFAPDGRTLAWAGQRDPRVRLLEVATGKQRLALTGHRGVVRSLSFAPDGKALASGSDDTTALVWDLAGTPGKKLTPAGLSARWEELRAEDAARAYRAVQALAASPAAVAFLGKHIRPVAPADGRRVARLIADLGSEEFAVRQKAQEGLEGLGERAAAACRKALAGRPSPEARRRLEALLKKQAAAARAPSGERVRLVRALEALELAGTGEARGLLAALAKGADGAWLTQEAKSTLARLKAR